MPYHLYSSGPDLSDTNSFHQCCWSIMPVTACSYRLQQSVPNIPVSFCYIRLIQPWQPNRLFQSDTVSSEQSVGDSSLIQLWYHTCIRPEGATGCNRSVASLRVYPKLGGLHVGVSVACNLNRTCALSFLSFSSRRRVLPVWWRWRVDAVLQAGLFQVLPPQVSDHRQKTARAVAVSVAFLRRLREDGRAALRRMPELLLCRAHRGPDRAPGRRPLHLPRTPVWNHEWRGHLRWRHAFWRHSVWRHSFWRWCEGSCRWFRKRHRRLRESRRQFSELCYRFWE